jgi:hypothetical protein
MEEPMTDLISRFALLAHLRKERDDYFREHFFQDPATGTWEASNAKEEWLEELDERIAFFESFPGVEPIAKLVNNNQVGNINLIETAPNITIDIGTPLYIAEISHRAKELDAAILRENAQPRRSGASPVPPANQGGSR